MSSKDSLIQTFCNSRFQQPPFISNILALVVPIKAFFMSFGQIPRGRGGDCIAPSNNMYNDKIVNHTINYGVIFQPTHIGIQTISHT